jgi:hypothetical protein
VPGSQAEIFISYAHEDNLPFSDGGEGWVTAFHRALEVYLGKLVGRQLRPSIWRDPKLRGDDVFDVELAARLAKAAALVCVVSPSYLGSEWCQQELRLFLEAGAAGAPAGKVRLFKVLTIPMELKVLHGQMQKSLGYNFFKEDREKDSFMPLDPAIDPAHRPDYWAKLNDLAQDLSRLLRSLQEPPMPVVGPESKPEGGKPSVYLADTTFDLQREHDEIKRDLLRHGYRVVPGEQLPLVASQLETFVREQLADCQVSVHLVGRKYGIVPEETEQSVVALQNSVASQLSGPGRLTRLIWLPPALVSSDERQSRLIDALRRDDRNHIGADLLEGSLEDLKTLIHQRLAPPAARPVSPPPGELVRVYLICDQRDVGQSAAIEGHLRDDLGLEVITPVFEGTQEELRQDHEESLATCDVVLIYYGEGNELWRRRRQRELQKSAGYGRQRKLLASAIYVAPPATPEKEKLSTLEAAVLRPASNPGVLDSFLSAIRDARARPAI